MKANRPKGGKQMNKYEIAIVLNAKLEDEARNVELDKIKSYVERFGGSVVEPIEDWGKKKLAYDIDHMNEGFYYFIPFDGAENTPKELEAHIRIMESVIRFLITKKES